MNNNGDLIVFEGLDCSFKETNSKLFKEYLEEKYKGKREVILHSFPSYESNSSYFVKEYLAGKYGTQDDLKSTTISTIFMMDMFDYFAKTANKVLDDGGIVILDRYWYSNIYYRLGEMDKEDNEDDSEPNQFIKANIIDSVYRISQYLDLPKADIVFKMKTEEQAMIDTVVKKNSSNDIHESDIEYLKCVYKEFENFSFYGFMSNKYYTAQINIPTAEPMLLNDKSYKILPRDQIFDSVKKGYEIINKYA